MSSKNFKKRKYTRSTRAKDKLLKGINIEIDEMAADTETRKADAIIGPVASLPFTITGLRWEITVDGSGWIAGQECQVIWVIARVPNGTTTAQKSLNWPDTTHIYDPEEDVLAWGQAILKADQQWRQKDFEGHTKSMRKMKGGDSLSLFVYAYVNKIPEAPTTFDVNVNAVFQWFQLS